VDYHRRVQRVRKVVASKRKAIDDLASAKQRTQPVTNVRTQEPEAPVEGWKSAPSNQDGVVRVWEGGCQTLGPAKWPRRASWLHKSTSQGKCTASTYLEDSEVFQVRAQERVAIRVLCLDQVASHVSKHHQPHGLALQPTITGGLYTTSDWCADKNVTWGAFSNQGAMAYGNHNDSSSNSNSNTNPNKLKR